MKKRRTSAAVFSVPTWAILFVSAALCLFLGSQFFRYEQSIAMNGDTVAFEKTAVMINALRAGAISDVPSYYPPLANFLFLSAENNVLGLPFHRALALLFVVCGIAAAGYIALVFGTHRLRWLLIAVPGAIALLEPAVFFARFDFFPMLAILLACLSLREKRFAPAGVFLLLGCALKLAPVFLIPLFHLSTPAGQRRHFWTGLATAALGVAAMSFLLLGIHGTLQSLEAFFTLRTSFPPYALSSAAAIDLFTRMALGGHGTIKWIAPDLGHFDTGLPVVLSSFLLLCGAAGSFVIAFLGSRGKNPEQAILLTASATLFWLLFITPLLTMHYYLWVLPLPILWFLEQTESTRKILPWQAAVGLLAVTIGLLGQWMYPHLYFALVDFQTPLAITVNFLRNIAVLLAVFACLLAVKEARKKR